MGSERVIWERFADAVGIGSKFVLKTIMAMTANMNAAAKEVADIQNKEWGYAPIIDDILEVIKSQILRMEQAILHWNKLLNGNTLDYLSSSGSEHYS